jgi:hypothetical protein
MVAEPKTGHLLVWTADEIGSKSSSAFPGQAETMDTASTRVLDKGDGPAGSQAAAPAKARKKNRKRDNKNKGARRHKD